MILGFTFVVNIFGRFGAYHVFDELLEKIAFVVSFPNCLDLLCCSFFRYKWFHRLSLDFYQLDVSASFVTCKTLL